MDCRIVQIAPSTELKVLLTEGANTIGRDPKNTIQILSDSLSRFHARITRNDNHCTLEDLKSSNGTFLNDEPVGSHRLTHGDEIVMGEIVFRYEEGTVSRAGGSDFVPKRFSNKTFFATVRVSPSTRQGHRKIVKTAGSPARDSAQRLIRTLFGGR